MAETKSPFELFIENNPKVFAKARIRIFKIYEALGAEVVPLTIKEWADRGLDAKLLTQVTFSGQHAAAFIRVEHDPELAREVRICRNRFSAAYAAAQIILSEQSTPRKSTWKNDPIAALLDTKAAQLLMPWKLIREDLQQFTKLQNFARKYRVNNIAAADHLTQLGYNPTELLDYGELYPKHIDPNTRGPKLYGPDKYLGGAPRVHALREPEYSALLTLPGITSYWEYEHLHSRDREDSTEDWYDDSYGPLEDLLHD